MPLLKTGKRQKEIKHMEKEAVEKPSAAEDNNKAKLPIIHSSNLFVLPPTTRFN